MGIAEAMDDVVGSGLGLLESTFRPDDRGVDTSAIFKLMKKTPSAESLVDDAFTPAAPQKRLSESDNITISRSELKALIQEAVYEALQETDNPMKAAAKTAGISNRDVKKLPPESKVELLNAGNEELEREESYSGNSFARRFAELLEDSQKAISEPDEMDIDPELSGEYFDVEAKEEELHADLDMDDGQGESQDHLAKVTAHRNVADGGINGVLVSEAVKRIWKNSVNEVSQATSEALTEVLTKQELNTIVVGLNKKFKGFSGMNENKVRQIFNTELENLSEELGLL